MFAFILLHSMQDDSISWLKAELDQKGSEVLQLSDDLDKTCRDLQAEFEEKLRATELRLWAYSTGVFISATTFGFAVYRLLM